MAHSGCYEDWCDALRNGKADTVRQMLDGGFQPNAKSLPQDCNALCMAKNQLPVLRLLLTNRCSPMDPNVVCCSATILHHAVKRENEALLKLLLTEAVVNVNVCEMTTCLSIAIKTGNIHIVKLLLDGGASIDCYIKVGSFHFTPLMLAIDHCESLDMCKLLVEYGSNVNYCDTYELCAGKKNFSSALHISVKHDLVGSRFNPGYPRMEGFGYWVKTANIVKYLVEDCGADVNVGQGTVIQHIIETQNGELMQYILENGYKPYNNDGTWKYNWLVNMQPAHDEDIIIISVHAPFNRIIRQNMRIDDCLGVLLRWGFNNITTIKLSTRSHRAFRPSLFRETAVELCLTSMALVAEMYPQCLQEEWFVDDDIPEELRQLSRQCEQVVKCLDNLREERKSPPQLEHICRARIFAQLGYNPQAKVEKMPLPRKLRDFVMFKDVKGM